MEIVVIIFLALSFFILLIAVFVFKKKRLRTIKPLSETQRALLSKYIPFYQELDNANKISFEQRMQLFLSRVRITGVNTTVEDLDKVLVAASAIIPIFGFPDWEYINLHEVLLYPDSFSETFNQEGADRNTLGLIGTGPFQNIMILSKRGLREGFLENRGRDNAAIHEFIHLIDKTDGAVDGIPEFMLSKQYILPWLDLMQKEILKITANRSDINPYGATNQAEFFAVVSEYFFDRPDLLEAKHPELYNLLSTIFRQNKRKK